MGAGLRSPGFTSQSQDWEYVTSDVKRGIADVINVTNLLTLKHKASLGLPGRPDVITGALKSRRGHGRGRQRDSNTGRRARAIVGLKKERDTCQGNENPKPYTVRKLILPTARLSLEVGFPPEPPDG